MILVEIRPRQGKKQTIGVGRGITVLGGLGDAKARKTWAEALRLSVQGRNGSDLDLDVEIDGKRQKLTPELISRLGLADAGTAITVLADDLPGAAPVAPAPEAGGDGDLAAAETEVATAEAKVRELRSALERAERAATETSAELTSAGRLRDTEADGRVAELESQLEAARSASASARRNLEEARAAAAAEQQAAEAGRAEIGEKVSGLRSEHARLESGRAALVARLVEIGDPGDPAPVEKALEGLRRLRQVKPKPSPAAIDLADRWVAAHERLAALPAPPQPPEWLVAPALAALQEAREALAKVDSGSEATVDPALVESLDRAHREVLEAEQRSMRKGSRTNRKRLEQAQDAEREALSALGVGSYGEYLQRIAPGVHGGGPSREERVASAKAALADAEAVWEELHGGQASPEWTAAKEQQAAVRVEALALLDRDIADEDLEDVLRGHVETVVDTAWAEQALAEAMHRAGARVSEGVDHEAAAEAWLADSPAQREQRAAAEAELGELDRALALVEEQLAEHQADAFFGDEGGPTPAASSTSGPLKALADAAADAEVAERELEATLDAARARHKEAQQQRERAAALEHEADARRAEVDDLRRRLAEAEAAEAASRAPKPAAATEKAGPADGGVDLSKVVPMEVELYVLARLSALRSAPGGPLPLVVDGGIVAGLPPAPSKRLLGLLERASKNVQVIVVGDDGGIAAWAAGLGDQATVRTVAR